MRLMQDCPAFPYRGYHGCFSKCRLRIFEPEDNTRPYVVIATELESNPGTSITNAAERIATAVWHLLERPVNGMCWIEHYADRAFIGTRPMLKEEFDIVEFDSDRWQGLKNPKWRPSSKEEVEAMIGCPIGV
jgi:hypothetical protein